MKDSIISEFMTLKQPQKAFVIYEMVKDIAMETELPIEVCCKIIAEYKGWSVNRIKKYLNLHDEKYLMTVGYYENQKPILKKNIANSCYNILKDNLLETIQSSPFMTPASLLKETISEWATDTQWYK